MLSYEVMIRLEDPQLEESLVAYMTGRHVAEVFATGFFVAARFEKSASLAYRSRYTARSRAELDRYLAERAPALRADFLQHFPAGVTLTRAEWEPLAEYGL